VASGKRGCFVRKYLVNYERRNYFINRKISRNSVLKDEIENKQENESWVAYLKYLHGRL
jgi:hypothetical protein